MRVYHPFIVQIMGQKKQEPRQSPYDRFLGCVAMNDPHPDQKLETCRGAIHTVSSICTARDMGDNFEPSYMGCRTTPRNGIDLHKETCGNLAEHDPTFGPIWRVKLFDPLGWLKGYWNLRM